MKIPFNKVSTSKNEKKYLEEVYANGKFSGDGPLGKKCESFLRQSFDAKYAMVTSSCTHALDMAMELVVKFSPQEKNEVLLSSFTFSSTANSVVLAGLKPVFCDIDPVNLNISVDEIKKKISSKTAAIYLVHYAVIPCEIDEIQDLANQYKCFVIEDAAHAVGSKYKGRSIGSISDITLFSFHETKNISCGEGGAFLTNNNELYQAALIFREKGTNRSQFFQGLVDKYTWVSSGSSPLLAEPLSAILLGQLETLQAYNQRRKEIYFKYLEGLADIEQKGILKLPSIPEYCESNFHLFHILLKTNQMRNDLLKFMNTNGVMATFHYIPLHSSPFGQTFHSKNEPLPITDSISERLLRLPLYPSLTNEEVTKILSTLNEWVKLL